MPAKRPSSPAYPARPATRQLCRVGEEYRRDFEELRGDGIRAAILNRTVIQCAAASAAICVLNRYLPVSLLLGWTVLLATTLICILKLERGLEANRRRRVPRLFRPYIIASGLNVCTWSTLVWMVAEVGNLELQVQLWAVSAFLIAASGMLLPGSPSFSILLAGTLSALHIATFLASGQFGMGATAIAFALLSAAGIVQSGRRYRTAKRALAVLQENEEVVSLLLREFEDSDADWLWEIDTTRRVRSASRRFAYALAREPQEAEGQYFLALLAGEGKNPVAVHASLIDLAERLNRRESFSDLLVQVTIGDTPRWWELSGTPKTDEYGRFAGFRGVGSDVTAARLSSEKIAYLARYDTLTGLPNRLMLTEVLGKALEQARERGTTCAFLMIDLDRFKTVNDTLGHQVGDQLLAHVSERLRGQMIENQTCCRLGGDEFAVVIDNVGDAADVAITAQRIIDELSQPYGIEPHMLFVGASVGSALGPRDGANGETLMRSADLALYRAKDAGGNAHFTYEPSLHAVAEERRQLEAALRTALQANEFELEYQPVVDAQHERIVGLEALLRWNNAQHGLVSPSKFVPVAEDTRLVIPIGEWVLRKACLEAIRWPDAVRIAVNVSGEQLLDPNFSAVIVRALSDSGLTPQRLEIEVTESIFLRDANLARTALEEIMALGCTVALDDFGTGYSSLGYLRELHFSTIKVDRSFVQGAAVGNSECLAIIRAVVAMANSLGISTTAEGVETIAELDVARSLGCNKIQGFYFGYPMPASDALELFDSRLSSTG
ncbi:EAL domain-containing protein [Novosphingobium sp. RD2P27]|uniref:EAL domain-containing protein n=1 Tax=Novosphingobium kalidii TaxID=3230299 RepID=A0ABV2CYE7_9SPHN